MSTNDATVTPLRPKRPCPECGRPSARETYPFCSTRCKELDLNRWLKGVYVLPGVDNDADTEERPRNRRGIDRPRPWQQGALPAFWHTNCFPGEIAAAVLDRRKSRAITHALPGTPSVPAKQVGPDHGPNRDAQVAQLVEHATENRSVGGSIPPLGTTQPISL